VDRGSLPIRGGVGLTPTVLLLWLAFPVPDITGDSTCPTPPEVRARLAAMANAEGGETAVEPAPHRAYLSRTEEVVHVELLDAEGTLLAERTLEPSDACGDLAEAIAVVLATWEARFNPELDTKLVPLWPAPRPAPPPVVVMPSQPPPRRLRFDAGLGLLTSIARGEAVLGARLEGSLFPARPPLGLYAALGATATHTQSIDEPAGEAKWLRAALAVGPVYRLGLAALGLDVHAGGVLALLHVRGALLPNPASDTSLQLGLVVGVRGSWAWHDVAAWVGTDLLVYPGDDRLTIGNYDGDVGHLPRLEVQIAAGVGLGRFR
jgi:hypothetical protein